MLHSVFIHDFVTKSFLFSLVDYDPKILSIKYKTPCIRVLWRSRSNACRIKRSVWNLVPKREKRENRSLSGNGISTFQRESFFCRVSLKLLSTIWRSSRSKSITLSLIQRLSPIFISRGFSSWLIPRHRRLTISMDATPRSFRVCYRNGKYRYLCLSSVS